MISALTSCKEIARQVLLRRRKATNSSDLNLVAQRR